MINILTLKIGSKYSSKYVNNLFYSLKQNSTIPFKFYCYTEDPTDLSDDIQIIDLQHPEKYKLQWHKLLFHKDQFGGIQTGEKCLILDIDWIILKNVDDILSYDLKSHQFGCIERWWSNRRQWCMINGGFQMYYMGKTHHLYDTFESNYAHWQEHYINIGEAEGPVNGEQNFIDNNVKIEKNFLPKQWFCKYDDSSYEKINLNWSLEIDAYEPYYMQGEFHDDIKMVHFSNSMNLIHNYDANWIKTYWK